MEKWVLKWLACSLFIVILFSSMVWAVSEEPLPQESSPLLMEDVDLSKYIILKAGYTGPEVAALKQRMFELGYFKTKTVNESFTTNTAEYVKKFEALNGLLVDGIADPQMQSLFYSDKARRADGALVVPEKEELSLNKALPVEYSSPEAVVMLQQRFNELGYLDSSIVNYSFAANTDRYIKKFEENNGWLVDGFADPELLSLIFSDKARRVDDAATGEDSIEITDEYKQEVVNQIMDFQGPEIAPIPTNEIRTIYNNWEEENYGPYRQGLKELGAEDEKRITFGAKSLFAYDYSRNLEAYNASDDRFQYHVSRQEIIDFVLTGKHDDVFADEAGNMVWIIMADKKADKKIKQGFKDAIDWFAKNGAPDALESVCNNGLCVIFSSLTQSERGAGSTYFNDYGVMWQNMDSNNIRNVKFGNIMIRNLSVEPYGIIYGQYSRAFNDNAFYLGGSFGNMEVVKNTMASYVSYSLNSKDPYFLIIGEDLKLMAEHYANEFSISEDVGKRQIQFMADFIDPIGYESLWDVKGFSELVDLKKNR